MKLRFHFAKKVKGFWLTGWLIRLGQGTAYNHVAMEVSEDGLHDEPMVFESVIPRSLRTPLSKWKGHHYEPVETFEFFISDPRMRHEVIAELYRGLDRKYSVFQICLIALGLAIPPLALLFGRQNWNGGYFLHCSEYGANIGKVLKMTFAEQADTIDLIELRSACHALKEKGVYHAPNCNS